MPEVAETEDEDSADTFVERADYIPNDELLQQTATGGFLNSIHNAMITRGTKLLVGPRGCGKTHMMRYSWLMCCANKALPLAIYVSFNKYYRLEPLLKKQLNAVDLFHVWVLGRVIQGILEVIRQLDPSWSDSQGLLPFPETELGNLIARLERNLPLSEDTVAVSDSISTEMVIELINKTASHFSRKRSVLLLDDAALTLTPEYLFEFFDLVRVLKTGTISPKASVYPATEFGPRFHAKHEADIVSAWLSVDDVTYLTTMEDIVQRRFPNNSVKSEVSDVLKYAAFGVPRAYLTMTREYLRLQKGRTQQQVLNRVVEENIAARREEFSSLKIKLPRFDTLVRTGEQLFDGMVDALRDARRKSSSNERYTIIGIPSNDIDQSPLRSRMINLLIEAGLIFEHPRVSHGDDRIYRRYTPHLAALLAARAFSGDSTGSSARLTLEQLKAKPAKNPVRRSLDKLLPATALPDLRLDLPPCSKCSTPRLSESQSFCHHCGAQLLDHSTFTACMQLPLLISH